MSRAEVQSFKVRLTSASGVPAAIRENVHARKKINPRLGQASATCRALSRLMVEWSTL
jgi:hypothetical protein